MAVASDGKLPVSKSLVASLASSASVRSASQLLGPLATIITRLCLDPDCHHYIKTTAQDDIFIARLSSAPGITSVSVILSETLPPADAVTWPSQRLILGFLPFNSNYSILGRIITKRAVPRLFPSAASGQKIRNGVNAVNMKAAR